MTRIVALVQARMGSQRLPGKVLRRLEPGCPPTWYHNSVDGQSPIPTVSLTMLDWVVQRTLASTFVNQVVVATSTDPSDDPVADFCGKRGYNCYRGSLGDVLQRLRDAAAAYRAEVVARITADCPLVDPGVVDEVLRVHMRHGHDFTANRLPPPSSRTYPIGLDVEVATMDALGCAAREASSAAHREHVMPFLYEHPERFDVRIVHTEADAGDVRWTVDTKQDLQAVRSLVSVAQAGIDTPWTTLLATWRSHPELADINKTVPQKTATESDSRLHIARDQ